MNNPDIRSELLQDILAFCETRGIPKTTFGVEVLNDRSLVADIAGGRDLRVTTIRKIREYMAGAMDAGAA